MTTVQSSKVMPKVKTQQHRSSFFTGIIFLFIIFSLLEINFLFSSNSIKSNLGSDSFLILNRLYYLTENLNAFYPLIVGSHLVNGQNIIVPYMSQLGLQGVIISNSTQLLHIDPLLSAFTFSHIFVLILSLVFAILFTSLSKYFGFFPSLIGILLLGFSPWIALFGFSLYWTAFLLFIPFTICWFFYPYFVENQKSRPFFIFAIALSVCLKCLCGYEYITNVILSCIVPIYFHHFQNKSLNKQFIKNTIIILGAGVLGFIAAIGIHSLQLSLIFNTNGLELIAQRAKDRTGVTLAIPDRLYINNSINNLPENSWINQAVQNNWISPVIAFGILSFFKYFSFSAAEIPNILQNKNTSISIGTFTLVSLFLLLLLRFKLIKLVLPNFTCKANSNCE